MVLPTVKDEELKELFPKGVTVREMPSGKGYMRYTPDDPPESERECQEAKH